MVCGLDAVKVGKDAPLLHSISASCNVYFTSYYSTWRVVDGNGSSSAIAGTLMKEALAHFYQKMRRMPDTIVIYRSGASESQETALMEHEMHDPDEGILAAFDSIAEGDEELAAWRGKVTVAYIMVKRSSSSRFMAEDGDNLPSGSYITDEDVMPGGEVVENPMRFDFYMVSQTYVVGTARPTLYTVLYNTLSFSKLELIQLTHRLCGLYMTFAGKVSIPAPLKYAAKLLSLLSKCTQVPKEPPEQLKPWRRNLFFI